MLTRRKSILKLKTEKLYTSIVCGLDLIEFGCAWTRDYSLYPPVTLRVEDGRV